MKNYYYSFKWKFVFWSSQLTQGWPLPDPGSQMCDPGIGLQWMDSASGEAAYSVSHVQLTSTAVTNPRPEVKTVHRTKQVGGRQLSRARKVSQLWYRIGERASYVKRFTERKRAFQLFICFGPPCLRTHHESHESQQTKYRHRHKSYKRRHTGMERVKLVTVLAA